MVITKYEIYELNRQQFDFDLLKTLVHSVRTPK